MATNEKSDEALKQLKNELNKINNEMINSGLDVNTLKKVCYDVRFSFTKEQRVISWTTIAAIISGIAVLFSSGILDIIISYVLGTRCILPNNYFIWEATRPISNCQFCINVTRPIILPNVTREQFAPYAFTSKPVIVKNAVRHWPAMKHFNFTFLKDLYDNVEGSYESVEEDCQFLHFHSDFVTLRDVFAMTDSRANLLPGEKPWYIGWCSYNQNVLNKMRQYYPVPHFLPEDSELSNHEYIFMGYDQGATMHLDFISRLMWQAQLLGNKTWHLIPSPECQNICQSFTFYVEPGDADTRVWYHGTTIAPGEFSLTIQSEYS